jgi:hypothetical protein
MIDELVDDTISNTCTLGCIVVALWKVERLII